MSNEATSTKLDFSPEMDEKSIGTNFTLLVKEIVSSSRDIVCDTDPRDYVNTKDYYCSAVFKEKDTHVNTRRVAVMYDAQKHVLLINPLPAKARRAIPCEIPGKIMNEKDINLIAWKIEGWLKWGKNSGE